MRVSIDLIIFSGLLLVLGVIAQMGPCTNLEATKATVRRKQFMRDSTC